MSIVTLEFVHVPDGRTSVTETDLDFVQITYDVVRIQRHGVDEDEEIAYRTPDGFWRYEDDLWTDFIVSAVHA